MIRAVPCPCGHKSCRDQHLQGIGKFVQGSGFTPEEAERVVAALNQEVSPALLRLATDAHMLGSVTYLNMLGLSGDDQPTVDQLKASMEAGIRAAIRQLGLNLSDER